MNQVTLSAMAQELGLIKEAISKKRIAEVVARSKAGPKRYGESIAKQMISSRRARKAASKRYKVEKPTWSGLERRHAKIQKRMSKRYFLVDKLQKKIAPENKRMSAQKERAIGEGFSKRIQKLPREKATKTRLKAKKKKGMFGPGTY